MSSAFSFWHNDFAKMIKKIPLFFKVILGQGVLYGLLFLSSSNRTFFPPVIGFAIYLFFLLKDWRGAVWLTLVAVLPFSWGLRDWRVEIPMPFGYLNLVQGKTGLPPFVHFPLSASFLLSIFLLLTLVFHRKLRLERRDVYLLLFLIFGLVSLAFSPNLGLGFISYLYIFLAVVIYYLGKHFLAEKKIFQLTIYCLLILATFEGLLATGQFLLRRPLGRIIEENLFFSPFGETAAEDISQLRSSGTFSDPNTMAVFWLTLIPLIIIQALGKKPLIRNQLLVFMGLACSLVGLVTTFSRAAWLTFALVFLFLVAYQLKRGSLSFKKGKPLFFLILLVFLGLPPLISQRFSSLRYSLWGQGTSGIARIKLIQESWEMIKQKPFLGVGPGNFVQNLATNNFTNLVTYFPYPVHNLYLLIAAEVGLPALVLLVIFIGSSLRNSLREISRKTDQLAAVKLGIVGGLSSYLLAVLVYTGTGINLIFFFIFLGMCEVNFHETH